MIKILEHQIKVLQKVKKLIKKKKRGLLLFHALGSGKTITTLNIIKYFIYKKKIKVFYIICTNYLIDNWKKECEIMNIDYTKFLIFINIDDINNILNIQSDKKTKMIIIDEAHIILSKYIHSNKYDINDKLNLYQKLYSCFFTIYITGTPIIENITDLNIFENLCSEKNLLTNDKNLYPEYFIVNKFLFICFNKVFPILKKYTYQAPYFTIINIISTFIIIYLELYHDSLFDDFHKFISYIKYKKDFLGRNIFLPIKKKIEKKYIFNEKDLEKNMINDEEYIQYKKDYDNEEIKKSNDIKKLSNEYIQIKKEIILRTKISYFIKISFGLYYSFLSIIEIIRNDYIVKNKLIKFNYKKFLSDITSVDKYFISKNNIHFPNKINHYKYIYLNNKQTNKIVEAIVNKNFLVENCLYENKIICDLYNINYKEIPIDIILQISNVYKSSKFKYLLNILNIHKTNIIISCRYIKNSLKLVEQFLIKKKKVFDILYPNDKNNLQKIYNFENNKFDILLLHPDIIEGISIKNTKALILFDICQKYNIEQQIIGRCIRYNSHINSNINKVHIYKFISIFKKKILIKSLKKINDPSQSFDELLRDKDKIKFLSQFKSPDEIFDDANRLVEKIYKKL